MEVHLKKKGSVFLALMLALTAVAAAPAAATAVIPTELPRNETLYFAGQQWGTVLSWNIFGSNQNNSLVIGGAAASREIYFETLYMWNDLDGQLYPLLADGQPEWNAEGTAITVKINPAAHFNNGEPVTANDVVAVWNAHVKYQTGTGINGSTYISEVTAVDDATVEFKAALNDQGKPVNPLEVPNQLCQLRITSAAWIDALDAKANGDADTFKNDPAYDIVASGPYAGGYYTDETKIVLARDDSYWGVELWGKLPTPKYLAHIFYADNAAGRAALEAGEVDVSQQFNSDVEKMWLEKGLPISTYIDEPPYQLGLVQPSAIYNYNIPVLNELAVRKAIAIAVDYDQINANAMTHQSATFDQIPRSLFNTTEGQQAVYDHDAVKDLQWAGKDIEGAKKLLDEAGVVDSDGDGWREYNGEKISLNAVCPNGWSDWQASMEVVAATGKEIGIEITTFYPEAAEFYAVFQNPDQTQYAIYMQSIGGSGPTYPWNSVRAAMSGEFIGQQNNGSGNWGQYVNPRIDEIIAAIPQTTDEAELKALYTEAVQIYLTDIPSFQLMYRPSLFHTVNESVWTSYPEEGDAHGYPPNDCTDGYGVGALYDLELVNP
ncbi:MAG: ABC transporter substrate-binding protein [Oscillospiraceae bacterium]|jgi:peptide/nickel transport system substrate-binding protein|nr:ABC transporter substrate-binding protein [Oscillospiraceae bacterium]